MNNKFFDDTLLLLSNTSNDIKNNVNELSSSIVNLENEINNLTTNSYKELDERITELKKKVEINGIRIDNIDKEEELEKKKLLTEYYKTIVTYKSNFSNFNISNTDTLLNSVDVYTNESNNILNMIESMLNNRNNYSANILDKTIDVISKSLTKYSSILKEYEVKLSETFSDINNGIIKISNDVLKKFDCFFKNDLIIKNSYLERKESILNKIPNLRDLLTNYNDAYKIIYNQYDNLLVDYEKEYIKSLDAIKNEFIKENSTFIKVINDTVIKAYSFDNITDKKRILLDFLNKEIYDSELENKIITINNSVELDNVITDIYKFYNKQAFNEYENRIKNLEIELINNKTTLDISKLFIKFNKDKTQYPILENELLRNEISKEINNNYKEISLKRLSNIHDLNDYILKELNNLNLIYLTFLRDKDFIINSFKNDLKNIYSVMNKEITLLSIDNLNNDYCDKLLLKKSLNQFLKVQAQLEYNQKIYKIHHDYISKKSLYKLDYELKKQEKNIELLSPNFKLTKIVTEYETLESQFKLIYDSLTNTLNDSKIRNETLELSTYKYAYSLLNHRLLISKDMLEMAKKEYELRVEILTEIRNTSSSFNNHRYNDIISKYLEQINDLEKLKNIDLNAILSKIEINTNIDSKNDKKFDKNVSLELVKTLDEYDKLINGVQNLLKNDKEIKFGELNKTEIDDTIFDGIESAQEIENNSIKVALKSIEKAHEDFHDLIDSLENETINYSKAYESYKTAYDYEHLRLESYLEKESEPYLDEIKKINDKYANLSLKEFYNLDKEHDKETNKLFTELLDRFYEIDKEYNVNENDFIEKSSIKDIEKEKYIKEFNIKMEESRNDFLKSEENLKKKYLVLFDEEENNYNNSLSVSLNDYRNNKKDINKKIKTISKNNSNSIKLISRILYKDSKKYYLGYEAFEKEMIDKINKNLKNIKKKNTTIEDIIK